MCHIDNILNPICETLFFVPMVDDILESLSDYPLLQEIVSNLYIVVMCIIFIGGPIVGIYVVGKNLRKDYLVPTWYFWTAYVFVGPVVAAPLLLFLPCFMDDPKIGNYAPLIFLLLNSYSLWLIGGFSAHAQKSVADA